MANYTNGLVLTDKGRELQSKAQSGTPLTFTRVGLGSGQLPIGTEVSALTDLLAWEMDAGMLKHSVPGDGTSRITVAYTNQELIEGFYWREVGIYAMDGTTEILYAVSNAGDYPDFIPAGTAGVIVENEIELITVVGNATSVTATINDSLVYATKQDFTDFETRISNDVTTITTSLEDTVNIKLGEVQAGMQKLERAGEISNRDILDVKMKLSEAQVIQFLNKTGVGYYDLFTDTTGIDAVTSTATVSNMDVTFLGLQILKFKPQTYEAFNSIELAIYDKDRNKVIPEVDTNASPSITAPAVPSSLEIGDKLYKDGEIYTITAIEVAV
ncbi:hypothetical protein EUAN_06810 [Andreesenia angusta]|uniref:Phage tail fibre protein N-terminal domain-containing protein n=1 Tax=Andreesenia angusta TaxID=39480 RepID=A0A1S1V9T9_9FIRM|nr:phage tail protein [Andreesenia angusta]OHW62897.1 hypothetical protein EUAN_06810 [Andreesenia angusta]